MRAPVDAQLLNTCMDAAASIALDHAIYSPAADAASAGTPQYYRFLAGLVRQTQSRRIAELGTHFGGSIQAMVAGLHEDQRATAQVATVDVTALNRAVLDTIERLTCVQGDALDPAVVQAMLDVFDDHVDLLLVDTIHSFAQTLENTAVYANRLKPALIVFDDIHLNPDMERFWRYVERSGAGATFDVTDASQRGPSGLGLLVCRYPFSWPEASTRVRTLKRAAFSARLKVAGALTTERKEQLRRWLRQPTRH